MDGKFDWEDGDIVIISRGDDEAPQARGRDLRNATDDDIRVSPRSAAGETPTDGSGCDPALDDVSVESTERGFAEGALR